MITPIAYNTKNNKLYSLAKVDYINQTAVIVSNTSAETVSLDSILIYNVHSLFGKQLHAYQCVELKNTKTNKLKTGILIEKQAVLYIKTENDILPLAKYSNSLYDLTITGLTAPPVKVNLTYTDESEKTITAMAGYDFGKILSKKLMNNPKPDTFIEINVDPKIQLFSSSFVQGFFAEYLNKYGWDDFNKYIIIKCDTEQMEKSIRDRLF